MAKKTNIELSNKQLNAIYKGLLKFSYGIDIGGSGIKGAYVNLKKGKFASVRIRIPTPRPATPEAIFSTIDELLKKANVPKNIAVGITFPGLFQGDKLLMAANLDGNWSNINPNKITEKKVGRKVFYLNDADAAGLAESLYADKDDFKGTVLVLTLGTGIGSALIIDSKLVPNIEFGHVLLPNGKGVAEKYVSSKIFEEENLSYKEYAKRLQVYFDHCNFILNPKRIIVGGGISKHSDKFFPMIKSRAELVPAKLLNSAVIVGAAYFAVQKSSQIIKKPLNIRIEK